MQKYLLVLAMSVSAAFAATAPSDKVESKMDRMESKAENKMERAVESTETTINQQGVTADTQMKSSDSRTEITRRLRARIMADDQLSTQAHNVTIVTNEEAITLKGKVANRAEKVKLENYARSMAGDMKVFNQLEYKR